VNQSRDIRLSSFKGFAAHRCEIVSVGYGYETDPRRYAYDNRHREKFSLLQWTVSGEGRFRADREYVLTAGRAFLVNSPSPTAYWLPAGSKWEFYYVLFVGDMARWHVTELLAQRGAIYDGPVPELLRRTYHEAAAGRSLDRFTLSARLYQLLMDLYRGAAPEVGPVERAVRFIHQRYTDPLLAVEHIAAFAGLSPYHFSRLFRAQTGHSPWAYLVGVRLERARDLLLSTARPAKEISQLTGFRDYSYFCRVFRQHTGQTPGRLRGRK